MNKRCFLVTLATALLLFAGCSSEQPVSGDELGGMVRIDGSSTVYPITESVAEEFRAEEPAVRVTVGVSGTGGGFKKFIRGETDISNASRPIKPSELEAAEEAGIEFIELPVAYDGIAVVVNPANDWADLLTVEELKRLWRPEAQDKVMRWNQVRTGWPDRPIQLFGPGIDSGTYDYFTQAIGGEEGASRGDFTASEDDNVLVQGVAADSNALGFFGYAYYEENQDKLKAVPVDDGDPSNGDGPILPSPETVANSTYQPLSRPVFIYVRRDSADRPQVERFIEFYLTNSSSLVREVGYIPLPDEAYALLLERFRNRVTGTLFGGEGSQVGVSVEALLREEAK